MRASPRRLGVVALASALACAPLAVVQGQDDQEGAREEADVVAAEEEALAQEVESDVRTEGDTKVKVFEFSGLDVSGRLKSPQLMHFLNRLRAEFDRPRLPHRSFIPELQRSSHGKAFR